MKKLPVLSLQRRGAELANARRQREILESASLFPSFDLALQEGHCQPLAANGIDILQVNVGKLCNMTCRHCHVDAGPDRREIMNRKTIDACLKAIKVAAIPTLDLTGGAPEMNPDFLWLLAELKKREVEEKSNPIELQSPSTASPSNPLFKGMNRTKTP